MVGDRSLQYINHTRPINVIVKGAEDASGLYRDHPHPKLASFHSHNLGAKVNRGKQIHQDAIRFRYNNRFYPTGDPQNSTETGPPPPKSMAAIAKFSGDIEIIHPCSAMSSHVDSRLVRPMHFLLAAELALQQMIHHRWIRSP
jgi:hypothetical protein